MTASPRRSVVLLSGGMDSAVAAAWTRAEGNAWLALSVDYGQGPSVELDAARRVARELGAAEHLVLALDLRAVGGSALTGTGEIPKNAPRKRDQGVRGPGQGHGEAERLSKSGTGNDIPVTYVPARNTILLALGVALAEARGANAVVIGANAVDYSGYPDCRPEFLRAFSKVAELGTKAGVEGRAPAILAPLIDLSKAEIVALGERLGVPFANTVSCYDPDPEGRACGQCESCRLRRRGFAKAGVFDPTRYARS